MRRTNQILQVSYLSPFDSSAFCFVGQHYRRAIEIDVTGRPTADNAFKGDGHDDGNHSEPPAWPSCWQSWWSWWSSWCPPSACSAKSSLLSHIQVTWQVAFFTPTFSCHQGILSPRIFYTQGDLVHIPLNNHNDINKASNWTNGVHSHLADWIEDVRGHWYLTQTQLFFILWHSCLCLPLSFICHCICLLYLYYDFHDIFPKLPNIPAHTLRELRGRQQSIQGIEGGGVDLC